MWRVVLSFVNDESLVTLWHVSRDHRGLLVDTMTDMVDRLGNPHEEMEWYDHGHSGSTHRCRHVRSGRCRLSHDRKNHRDWTIATVNLLLCSLCYTYGLWSFFNTFHRMPFMRVDGSRLRHLVCEFQRDRVRQRAWAGDRCCHALVTTLPRVFCVTFYQDSQAYDVAMSALATHV
jgi:hypothetical protein